jgi:hypothetical protein
MSERRAGLPRRLRLGPFVYRVRHKANKKAFPGDGQQDWNNLEIRVDPAQQDGCARDTLLHEVMHACYAQTSFRGGDVDEEGIINALTPWLLGVLRDNPELIEFLTKEEAV